MIKQTNSAKKAANSNARQNKAARREESAPYSPHAGNRGVRGGVGGGNKRVYVGNLAYECTWKELKDFCAQMGKVTRADVAEYEDSGFILFVCVSHMHKCCMMLTHLLGGPFRIGRSKGWGIVEFASENVAQKAISMLNDKELLVCLMFCQVH